MPTPEGLDTTTLHGLYVEPDQTGTPLQGTLTFTPNPNFVTFPTENLILAGTETATLDVNGEFTIELVSTAQGTENPSDWVYTVTERIIGQRPRTFNIALPYASGTTVELADITPTEVAPTYLPVVGPQGPPGIVTTVNGYSAATITLAASDVGALATSARGAANGVASLDASTKVPTAQIPDLSGTYITTVRIGAANGVAGLNASSLVPSGQLDLATSAPPIVGTSAVGVATKLAREDHTHTGVDLTTAQSIAGAKNFTTSSQTARFGVGVAPATHRARVLSAADEVAMFLEQTAAAPANPLLSLRMAAATDKVLASAIPADSVPRLVMTVGGALSWGPGTGAADVSFSRTAAGVLTTDGQIISTQTAPTAAGHLTRKDYVDTNFDTLTTAQTISGVKTFSAAPIAQAASAGTTVFNFRVTGDTVSRLTVGADGTLSWGPGGGTAVDTVLTRVASEGLQLNMAYKVSRAGTANVGFGTLVTADTFDRYRIYVDGLNEWGPGNAARDTNLYRSAANTLKTDDALIVVGNITAPNVPTARATGTETFVFSAESTKDVTVTFPVGRFSATPKVVASCTSSASGSSAFQTRPLSVSSTGMTLRINDVNGTARTGTYTADWIAEQG